MQRFTITSLQWLKCEYELQCQRMMEGFQNMQDVTDMAVVGLTTLMSFHEAVDNVAKSCKRYDWIQSEREREKKRK